MYFDDGYVSHGYSVHDDDRYFIKSYSVYFNDVYFSDGCSLYFYDGYFSYGYSVYVDGNRVSKQTLYFGATYFDDRESGVL